MYKFYWYPKCSTCKKAKAWLDTHQIDYQPIDMINTQEPTKETFLSWMAINKLERRRYFNTSGNIYKEEHLKEIVDTLSDQQAAEMLAARGMLVKRPILEKDGHVIFGWNETNYQTFTGVDKS